MNTTRLMSQLKMGPKMKMKSMLYHAALIPAVVFAFTSLTPQVASAQGWNFDCGEPKRSEAGVAAPAIMIMLDRSGSMSSGGGGGKTRWNIAKDSINGSVSALEEQMEFGIGFFSGTSASISLQAQLNAYEPIRQRLNNNSPSGGTPMAAAIQTMRTSETMRRTNQATAGMLITDGYPSGGTSSSITQACAMRNDDKQTLFVVGFSNGTDQAFNSMMAAAGGMQYRDTAGNLVAAQCPGGDPCAGNESKSGCTGSIQANNQTELENALKTITGELDCVYPVDTSLHPEGGAPNQPEALRVKLFGGIGEGVTLQHRDHDPDGEGWYYPNTNNPNQIRLTDYYCDLVADGDINAVETHMACPCDQDKVGTACFDPDREFMVCKQGTWQCRNGFDYCDPLPLEQCDENCPGWEENQSCHMDLIPGERPLDEQAALVAQERTRCLIGTTVCNNHQPSCQRRYNPMPETCNGLDDDCDGLVDNINESWSQEEWTWEGQKYNWAAQRWEVDKVTLTWDELEPTGTDASDYPQACYGEDLCRCRGSIGAHGGLENPLATPVDQFDAYLDDHIPGNDSEGCICVEN